MLDVWLLACHMLTTWWQVLLRRRCAASKCSQKPAYNYAGEAKPMYCDEHKLPEMVSSSQLALVFVYAGP